MLVALMLKNANNNCKISKPHMLPVDALYMWKGSSFETKKENSILLSFLVSKDDEG
jgi:hypothetical protein